MRLALLVTLGLPSATMAQVAALAAGPAERLLWASMLKTGWWWRGHRGTGRPGAGGTPQAATPIVPTAALPAAAAADAGEPEKVARVPRAGDDRGNVGTKVVACLVTEPFRPPRGEAAPWEARPDHDWELAARSERAPCVSCLVIEVPSWTFRRLQVLREVQHVRATPIHTTARCSPVPR